jgi:hypothetical protein
MPQGDQPLDFGQPPAPDGLRLATPVDQGLEVAFQVGVAQRASLGVGCMPTSGPIRLLPQTGSPTPAPTARRLRSIRKRSTRRSPPSTARPAALGASTPTRSPSLVAGGSAADLLAALPTGGGTAALQCKTLDGDGAYQQFHAALPAITRQLIEKTVRESEGGPIAGPTWTTFEHATGKPRACAFHTARSDAPSSGTR